MKKQSILFAMIFCACLCSFTGCGPSRIVMNVDSFTNQDLSVAEYKRFSFLPVNSEKQLMERQLFTSIRSEMEKKGYIYDDKYPHFLVSVQFGAQSQEKQGGVYSRPVQVYQPPPIGSVGQYGSYQTQYVTQGGGSYNVNARWMKIDFIDAINKKPTDKITYLWQAEVNSAGSSGLNEVAKCLISGLLLDYPVKLDKPRRSLYFDECK